MVNFTKNKGYFENRVLTEKRIDKEIDDGLMLLESIDRPIITFFGSHILSKDSKPFKNCYKLASSLGKKGYAIMSGGGPGIMEAANSAAKSVGTESVGLKAGLLKKEQSVSNSLFTKQYAFEFLFVRRFILALKSDALIFYPGGYGTLNELFEYLVLIQTGMTDKVPVICVDKKFWEGMLKWLKGLSKAGLISRGGIELLQFADTEEEVMKILNNNKS
jgi:uncharacterized protein (TIGR00730 family)